MAIELPPDDSSPPSLEREVYLQERRDLIQAEAEQTRSFDKSILTLSAGALGLSLTFIKDVVPKFTPCTGWLLYAGWASFVLSLLLTLSSFQTSIWAIRHQRAILDEEATSVVGKIERSRNLSSQFTALLNWSALILFVLGAAALALFVAINIYQPQGTQP
jgi:hypothetical protein